jgi:putative endonuclease
MAKHIDLGKQGEELATAFLQLKGYEILERNWRNGRAEIDIIAMYNGILIFVEVKARSTDAFGTPAMFVDYHKQKMITYAAPRYMEKINHDWAIRFDVLSILIFRDGTHKIEHIEDAFF